MNTTYLFLPAHDARKATRALTSGADAVVFDLEASVPDDHKDAARKAVRTYLNDPKPRATELWVRVNPTGPALDADVASIDWSRADGVVVARAEDPAILARLSAAGARRILPLIESATGFGALHGLASAAGVERFAIGTWDLLVDLALFAVTDPDESELIWQLRGQLVVASRQLGLAPPIDGICATLDNDARLHALCIRGRQLGFAGKLLVHPRQIPLVKALFGPDEERAAYAREIVHAFEAGLADGHGAIRVRDVLVDRPMVERARALLTSARHGHRRS